VKDRVGQVWSGVSCEDFGDVSLCVESGASRGGQTRHRFLDLETGELGWRREPDEYELLDHMERLA